MGNMSYCRFENTYQDLRECWDAWDEKLSESERLYQEKLANLCREIAGDSLV